MKTEIRPASAEDLASFDMAGKSARIIAAVRGAEVIGIAGVYRGETGFLLFAKLSDELKRDKRSMVRGVRAIRALMARVRAPLFANADPEVSGSDVLLRHLGFAPREGGPWQYKGGA